MKRLPFLAIPILLLGLALGACAGSGAPVGSSGSTTLSPRETAQPIATAYAGVLVAASTAMSSTLVPATAKKQLAASTHAATDVVLAYFDAAGRCVRDQATGELGDATGLPAGVHCDSTAVGLTLAAARQALTSSTTLLTQLGFPPAGAAVSPQL